jgi:hypothetical protein
MTQREHMEAEVQKWRESTRTKKEFCQQQGIKESTFGYWITRSNEKKKKGFLPLAERPSGSASSLEIIYPNGVRIKVSAQDLKSISQLISLG